MGTKTTRLDLLKPGENDYYNQQTEQADNWQKVDDYAVYTDRDKNAIWGGLDGGGLIEDHSVTKVVGKRYIGADGKAYICRVPSNINNSENYTPCNVVDNLEKYLNLQNASVLVDEESFNWSSGDGWSASIRLQRFTKNGITTKEVITISKPIGQGGTTANKNYFIPIPTSIKFPPKFWGAPIGIGTDDPTFGFNGGTVVRNPSEIIINFRSSVPNSNSITIFFTWVYNL